MKRTRLAITIGVALYCIAAFIIVPMESKVAIFQTSALMLTAVVGMYNWSEGKYPTNPRK